MTKRKLQKRYYWKELSSDGVLKEPEEIGPYYGRVSLNGWSWFETEMEAEEYLLSLDVSVYTIPDVVLVCEVSVVEEERV